MVVISTAVASAAGGGCLAGVVSSCTFLKLSSGKSSAGKGAAGPVSKDNPAGLAGAPAQSSISRWASPGRAFASPTNTVPIRDYNSSKKVDFDGVRLSSSPADFSKLGGMQTGLNEPLFLETLKALIGESKFLQNNPRLGVIPEEKRASNIVQRTLSEFSSANGGPLQIEELTYVEGRPNLKVVYPGTGSKTISFIGSHFDVVPADAESWSRDPFTLTQEGDKLYGRGTTDCLGHVALLTTFLYELGKNKPKLENSIIVCFIAAEEGGEHGVGVDMAVKHNRLAEIKNGPVYWVDCADSQPCLGTAGALSWSIKFKGRLFHSGFPHKGINSIELAAEAMSIIQERFYEDFPPVPEEDTYLFAVGSTMKPTQIECQKGSFNQICPETTVHGDIRLSPFYDVKKVMEAVEGYVKEANESMADLRTRGPYSMFVLGDDVETQTGETRAGVVELKWNGTIENFLLYEGVAVNLDSPGHKAMVQAFREAQGSVKPFAVNGTLPLVSQMKKEGFDLQLCGFGLMAVYHGIDEYCTLTDMKTAYEVVARMTALLESGAN